jgi:coenzyme F420-reducing hydrogenase delta subunit
MVSPAATSEVIKLDKDHCGKCMICVSACPFDALALDAEKTEVKLDLEKCQVCGICYSSCPAGAIDSLYYELSGLEKYFKNGIKKYQSTTLAIACKGSVANNEKLKEIIEQKNFIPLWLPCVGRAPPELIMLALSMGMNKIIIVSCEEILCRFENGSRSAGAKILLLTKLLQQLGYPKDILIIKKHAPKITIDRYKCIGCATCFAICPYDAAHMTISGFAELNLDLCFRCGRCVAHCPAIAIELEGTANKAILEYINELSLSKNKNKILIFKCIWAQFDAELDTFHQDDNIKLVNIPCAGRIDYLHILEAYRKGIDTVLIVVCEEDFCRLEQGSKDAKRRILELKKSLDKLGVKQKLELYSTTPKHTGELDRIIQSSASTVSELKTRGE